MQLSKRSNLLLLRGVYPQDFVIAIAETTNTVAPTAWTKMPKRFESVETWPQFSNLQCWTCDQKPTNYPKFIPVNPEKGPNGDDVCDVHGHFHTWNCAVDYVNKEFAADRREDALKAISLFESKFSGRYKPIIMPAYPKTEMQQYCGASGLTLEQWAKKMDSLDSDYSLTHYKLEHFINDV